MKWRETIWRIRPAGYILLVGGMLFLAYRFLEISGMTHPVWIWHCQNLEAGDPIPRISATTHLRDFQLEMNWLFRKLVFFPTVAMFIGGMILGLGRKPEDQNTASQDTLASSRS